MTLSHAARRQLALLTVCLGLPIYVVLAVTLITAFERLPFLLEALLYILVGIGWIFPTRWIFMGVGKADPTAGPADGDAPPEARDS